MGHDRPLLGEACPMPAWTMTPGVAVVVTEAPGRQVFDAVALLDVLPLTAAEARIAAALASGASVADVARGTQANPATIRWHLKQIYSKTGTGSEAQLVALVHRLGASRQTTAERHRRVSRARPRVVGT